MRGNALSSVPKLWGAVVFTLAAALAHGCGGGSSGKLMVDSPLTEFQAPDEDDVVGDEDDDADEKPAAPEKGGEE